MNNGVYDNALRAMLNGEYWNNKGVRIKDFEFRTHEITGNFMDEIFKIGDYSFYLYQGNHIAMFDHAYRKMYISNCGWKSQTTKERLNCLDSKYQKIWIHQEKWVWYNRGSEFIDQGEIIQKTLKSELERLYGIKNAYNPYTSVGMSVDTGMWDDSPYKSDDAQNGITEVMKLLKQNGIRNYLADCTTSNIFCLHHHIIVRACDMEKALDVIDNNEIDNFIKVR